MTTFRRRDRLSVKQAKKTLMVAFGLGILFSGLQLLFDYQQERSRLANTAKQFLEILDQPASLAAYNKDKDYARSLVVGYFSYDAVYKATIFDREGNQLASQTGELKDGTYRGLINRLFGKTLEFGLALNYQPKPTNIYLLGQILSVGRLEITLDTYDTGAAFLDRALRVLIYGFLRIFTLAIVILVIFHRFLTQPFLQLTRQIDAINPELTDQGRISVPPNHENDEFAILVSAENKLLAAIENNFEIRIKEAAEAASLAAEISERERRESEMRRYQTQLEESNFELETLLNELHNTQDALIESQTLSSLGGLVAGVAHELNTPLGIAVSSGSFMQKRLNELKESYSSDKMTEDNFNQYLEQNKDMSEILLTNLMRAADLVQSFKKTAVDQSHYSIEEIDLQEYLDLTLKSLEPKFKSRPLIIENQCAHGIRIKTYPGALSQIIINIFQNSLLHAFSEKDKGHISIQAKVSEDWVSLTFADDGKGIKPENLEHIFDPFFSTASGQGGTGLGLNIVYNLVTQKMKGSIKAESTLGQGVKMIVKLPMVI